MKQVVAFRNEGSIDVRSMKMFGVSVKDGTNPIGYFGTGLKYAIAILIRHGQTVKIRTGGESFLFDKKTVNIRGKDFEVITMNGEEMPFTTELGKNWELWQAFRELYCNCLDESGSVTLEDVSLDEESSVNKTIVTIGGAESIVNYHERDNIVLNLSSRIRIGEGKVEVFNQPSNYLYYRNVRVMKLNMKSLFTYNIIEQTKLTEDRTFESPSVALLKLFEAVATLKDEDHIRSALTTKSIFETSFEYSGLTAWGVKVSEEFDKVVSEEFDRNSDRLNSSARNYWREKNNRKALKNYQPERMTDVESKQFEKCIQICKKTFRDFEEYDVLIVKTLGEVTMAIAEIDQQRMIISKAAFAKGTKYLLSTIIEEYMHIKSGYHDCTRELQTHLFDSICTLIEEHIIREPI